MASGKLLVRLTKHGMKRGVLGGSRAWTYVGSFALLLRAARWITRERPGPVYRTTLHPGDVIEVRGVSEDAARRG